ncbi:MAG: DUF86 domain-containing protein [Dethiobacter sp.]|jgi:uncharacterized protein YutE (UPF0331/DUF86 family)|nr:DUF86 domain-containing protein [Dethiobacter sp.]
MVKIELIRQKIEFIEEKISKLESLKALSPEQFGADYRNVETSKHLLQVSIEAMTDMANHIVARNRWGIPAKSADSLRILREFNYFTEHEEKLFATMVKFRNRVVHLYQNVDHDEVYMILQENLPDFRLFIRAVVKNNFS